jgi:hypothetical protein
LDEVAESRVVFKGKGCSHEFFFVTFFLQVQKESKKPKTGGESVSA